MTPHQDRMNPYIQRMTDDMKLRNYADSTIDSYTWHATKFCEFFGKPAEELGAEEIRTYQLYLVNEKKSSWSSFNQAVCGLRFLYQVTMERSIEVKHIPYGKQPKKLPVVLSQEEALRLFECLRFPKHRMILLTCYAAGLRLAEATNLKIADIDGDRQQLHITAAKGNKQRMVPVSPRLLDELRQYWLIKRPANYLFPGKTCSVPLSSTTVQKACKLAASRAAIRKNVTPHALRHSWATGMLESGVDILTISRLMGHACFQTTMIYLHVRRQHFDRSPSPIDWLPVRQSPKWEDENQSEDRMGQSKNLAPDNPPAQQRKAKRRNQWSIPYLTEWQQQASARTESFPPFFTHQSLKNGSFVHRFGCILAAIGRDRLS